MKTLTLALAILAAVHAPAAAQTRGDRCTNTGGGDTPAPSTWLRYTFQGGGQTDVDLYFNNDWATFIVIVMLNEQPIIGSRSGSDYGDRFVHGSVRTPSQTLTLVVACINGPADFRVSVRTGNERAIRRTLAPAHVGLDAGQAARTIALEEAADTAMRALLASSAAF